MKSPLLKLYHITDVMEGFGKNYFEDLELRSQTTIHNIKN